LASATYEHTRPPNWKLPTVLLPLAESEANPYLQAMTNAAAFARANRLALTLMSAAAVRSELGDGINFSVVGDSPHNLIWQREQRFLHRKGACAADFSTPVFIPGSMGDSSWLLVGGGNEESLSSSAHGAGRLLSRGAAAHYKTAKGKNERLGGDANADIHVITPADPLRLLHSGRRDLLRERERRLREEAPRAYKPVETVVDSVVTADAAKGVARMRPILTIKA
jgi:tRNA-splicing ligase RtcB